jgi:glutathione S-transferase
MKRVSPTNWSRSISRPKRPKTATTTPAHQSKGQVPALQLDNGELLTEGPVIVQAIADQAAGKNLAPAAGSPERYRLQEWLNFITTELHKNFSPLFQPAIPDEVKTFFKDRIKGKFKYADSKLAGQDYLMGKQFTVADGYLFVMLKWAERTGMDLSEFKNLMAFKDRVAARPNVQAALKMEGLLKAA